LLTQVLVGALNVWLDEYEVLIVLHLALGTLLWWTVVAMTLSLYRVPSPVVAGGPVANPAAA
jgi:heme A synthase